MVISDYGGIKTEKNYSNQNQICLFYKDKNIFNLLSKEKKTYLTLFFLVLPFSVEPNLSSFLVMFYFIFQHAPNIAYKVYKILTPYKLALRV